MVVLTTFPPPVDGIEYKQSGTEAHVGSSALGAGTLFVAQSRLSWVGDSGQGFSLEYPAISMHAISRDLSSFHKECLYLMVEGQLEDKPEDEAESSDDENQDLGGKPYTEIRFAPGDTTCLDQVYQAMCSCQALHPDSDDSYSGDEDGEEPDVAQVEQNGAGDLGYFDNVEGLNQLTPQGLATLRHLESVFQVRGEGQQAGTNGAQNDEAMEEDGQFEDAD